MIKSIIKRELIGNIAHGDGSDHYYLLTCPDDNLTPADAEDYFYKFTYCDNDQAGSWNCHAVTVIQHPRNNSCIAIAHWFRNV